MKPSFEEEELRKVVMLNDRHKRNFETVRFFTDLILRAIRDEEVKPVQDADCLTTDD